MLIDNKIFADDLNRASDLEQRRVSAKLLRPDMRESELKTATYRHAAKNQMARDAGALWEEIALFLVFDHARSGRIVVAGSKVTLTPLRSFHPPWLALVLALDATLTSPEILDAAVFGDEVVGVPSTVTVKADISIRWPDHVWVRQILDAPVSMGALGIGEHAKPKPRNERDIIRFVHKRAALAAPAKIGGISYLGLRERIEGQAPANVRWMHFGATSGLNDFETVAGLIVIGRWWLSPDKVEARASVFAGYPVPPLGEFYRSAPAAFG